MSHAGEVALIKSNLKGVPQFSITGLKFLNMFIMKFVGPIGTSSSIIIKNKIQMILIVLFKQ